MSQLSQAKIHFNEQGTPVASDFDDVYFSNDGGLAETDYVFLQHNGLPQRWQNHQRTSFHIIETGFGTGANFLLTWLRFRQFRQQHPDALCQRLYFSSFEKYPLSHADLSRALSVHNDMQELCQLLLTNYPLPVSGCHRLSFDDGSVVLDLWLGDVNALLPELQSKVDAVYLDGFAPAKNPDMWQDTLFQGLARLSYSGTTVATFTSAGLVKRGLLHAGFNVHKVKGYGRKREMLTAGYTQANSFNSDLPARVTIIGGGIASLCLALALSQRGVALTLLCEDADVANQASQNRQGAVYPNLHATMTADSQIHAQAFLYAQRFYRYWRQQGLDFAHDWCGMLHLASNAPLQQRQAKLINRGLWPTDLVRAVDTPEASALAGIDLQFGGIYFDKAGWLSPKQFCQQALMYLQQQHQIEVHFNCKVSAINARDDGWQVTANTGDMFCSLLVLACGSALADFAPSKNIPLNKIRGQVTHVRASGMTALKTVLCHKGYITPQWQDLHCVGATFDRESTEALVKPADNTENLALVNQQLNSPVWFSQVETVSAAAAFRATLPDHLPLSGQLAPGLYALGAFGARGITLAPLLSEILASTLCNEPIPLSQSLEQRIAANRFAGKTSI